MLVVRKTNLNLKSCYFLFEGIKDQDDMRSGEKKENHEFAYGRKE